MKRWGILVIAGALALTACSSPNNQVAAPSVPPAGETAAVTPTPTATSATGAKSSRGNIIKQVGEGAGVTGPGGTDIVDFVVTAIDVDPKCTGDYPQAAENGHFVVLSMNYQTTSDYATQSNMSAFYPQGWKLVTPNGTTYNGSLETGQSFSCLNDSDTIPSSIGPGENVTGKVVLDVPTTEGTLIYDPLGLPFGWEYTYPAK